MSFAYWRKCDFQVHTPRDPNWQGARPLGIGDDNLGVPATKADVEQDRARWADDFVQQCADKGLEAIALTDHHEMVMVPYVQAAISRRRAAAPQYDLWLFPGMELTCRGGVQCLILFDADLSEDWRRQAQGKLGIVYADLDEMKAQGPKTTQLTANYADLASQLDSLGAGIKGKYIVLPNVSQGGQHTVLTDGHHADFKRMSYVGGYVDHGQNIANGKILPKNLARLSGSLPDWGGRYIYPLPTSDSRTADRATLGDNDTWIKLAAPTAESVRQAFLGHQSRISLGRPPMASLAVRSLKTKNSLVLADGQLNFSPELNSVIGGRGSGKSSMLEYLAFALGRACYDLRKDYSGNDRLTELIKDTVVTPGAPVGISLIQDGAIFKIVRTPGNGYQPEVTYPNGSKQNVSVKELRSLFPAVIYSQGELAELGKQAGKSANLTDLLQFVNPEYKRKDDRLGADIQTAKLAVRQALQDLITSWLNQAELRKLTSQRDATRLRVEALQKTLPTLSEADQAVIDRFDNLSAFESKREQAANQAVAILSSIADLSRIVGTARDVDSDLAEASEIQTAYRAFHADAVAAVENLQSTLTAAKAKLDAGSEQWAVQLTEARKLRDAALNTLGEHRIATTQIIALQQEVAQLTTSIGNLTSELVSPDDRMQALNTAISQLKLSVNARADQAVAWASEIHNLSNGKIQAAIDPSGDHTEIMEAIDTVAAKTGSQEASRQRQAADALASKPVWDVLDELRTDCLSALQWKLVGSSAGADRPACAALFQLIGGSERTQTTCMDLMELSRVEAIATCVPKASVALTYLDGKRQLSFEKASEGQRAAALLFMLLEQPGGPLIVDQPEGDLDNKIIADLTEKLHQAKQRRQIIFASHNANIVVNGSSELVAHLEMGSDGKRAYECAGAIDDPKICKTITETMEGGERAFKDRQNKYGY